MAPGNIKIRMYLEPLMKGAILDLSAWGSIIFIALLLWLWWKGITKAGAVAGMLSGSSIVIVWELLGFADYIRPGIFIPGVLPGFIFSFIIILMVSNITKRNAVVTPPSLGH